MRDSSNRTVTGRREVEDRIEPDRHHLRRLHGRYERSAVHLDRLGAPGVLHDATEIMDERPVWQQRPPVVGDRPHDVLAGGGRIDVRGRVGGQRRADLKCHPSRLFDVPAQAPPSEW